ncbi:DUF4880 domain-containing protein [Sphingosinicellaceae bacterium]|nr:DUF4880 domain-containing protein [Sphingosinicellaceae bacterium]
MNLSSGDATEADAEALEAWRTADPTHDLAFRQLAGMRPVARALKRAPVVDRRGVLAAGGAMVAGGIAFGMARPPLGLWPSYAELMADRRTGVGERLAFAPGVGVNIELNTRTSVSLHDAGGTLGLIDGEAFVAIDRATPFGVTAGRARLLATRAAFDVQFLGADVRVTCISGGVLCRHDGVTSAVRPDQQLTLTADGRSARAAVVSARAVGWRQGYLAFEATPLAEVVAQINRYRATPILLTDAALSQRPVSGVFYTDQLEAALNQLQQLLALRLHHLPGGVVLIS